MPRAARPSVGLLYNQTTPELLAHASPLVEHLAAMPDRLWYDFGALAGGGPRIRRARRAIDELSRHSRGRTLAGHGLGLSLPSAMPLDEVMANAVAAVGRDLGGFAWYSEHLSVFTTPRASVPNAQAGLGLPLVYDEETLEIVAAKLGALKRRLGCPLLLENGAFFAPLPEQEMDEAQFLNHLHASGACSTLLDLHNLLVGQRNGVLDAERYLQTLNLDAVVEVHLAGGDEMNGFYMDSHSAVTPAEVWEWAFEWLPRCRRLRAVTFEHHESYFEEIGLRALVRELEHLHELADACVATEELADVA